MFCEICEPFRSFTKNSNLARHIRDKHSVPEMIESGVPLRHLLLQPKYADKLRQYDALLNPVDDTEWHMDNQNVPEHMFEASTMVGGSDNGDWEDLSQGASDAGEMMDENEW